MNGSDARAAVAANDLSDWLIAHGQHFVTSDAVARILGVPKDQATTMIARQKARGRIFSPTRGAYVPIPPAVSYTHLDVYKRQGYGTQPAIRFRTKLRPTSGSRTSGTAGDRAPGRTDEAARRCASSSKRFGGRRKSTSPFGRASCTRDFSRTGSTPK